MNNAKRIQNNIEYYRKRAEFFKPIQTPTAQKIYKQNKDREQYFKLALASLKL